MVKKATPTPTPSPTPTPIVAVNIVDKCLRNISDSRLTKEIFLSIVGLTEVGLISAVANNSWFVTLATNSGEFGVNNAFSPDIYCGNSLNNSIKFLDSNAETKDYFFGGAGNDSVDSSWNSEFFGGDGNDSVTNLLEKSIFYGGDGNDSVSNIASDTKFLQETSTVYSFNPKPTPSPNPINTNVVTDATRFIQSLINDTPITNTANKTKIVMHVEPGKNGPFPDISENALTVAVNFYASLGIVLPQDTIHVLLGRTQNWLREQANIYAPGCVNSSYKFEGNASLCAYPNRSAIYSHLPTAVTMNVAAPDDIDLSSEALILRYTNKRIVDSFAGAAPHEAHHAWQDGSYGNASDVPKWLWEGGASLFGEMIYARLQSPTQSYLSLDPGLTGWGKSVCKGPIETMKPVCEYTQGLVVMEYFLYKLGVDSYIRLITQGNNVAFPVRFENATKVSLLSFYADVNKYLTLKGWNN